MYVYIYRSAIHIMYVGVPRGQKRVSTSLEQKLQVVMSSLIRVLRLNSGQLEGCKCS